MTHRRAHAFPKTIHVGASAATRPRGVSDIWTLSVIMLVVTIVATSLGSPVRAQSTAGAPPTPTCRQTVDSLDSRIRQNYAGFLLEVFGARRSAYESLLRRVRKDADRRAFEVCFPALDKITTWFDDPHLFVFQSATTDSADAEHLRASVQRLTVSESGVRTELASRRKRPDPIEGIWYDGATRLAVVPAPSGAPHEFVAVLLASDTIGWQAGDVRAHMRRTRDGEYATTLITRAFAEQQHTARLHRRVLLRFSPGMWGKAFPVVAADSGTLDSVDAHRPRVVVRPRSVLVSIPSHDPRFATLLDQQIRAAADSIRARKLLIVDLRGNEGGASFTTRALDPYVNSADTRVTPYDSGVPVAMSSPAQMNAARRMAGNDTSAFVRGLVARMQANPGKLVVLDTSQAASARAPVLPGDWHVVVMVDRGTVSAAEVLVLRALRSTRATVVGDRTAGALDYQSVQIISLGTGNRRWALGYPTITAHADLPRRGMRGKGIPPTVRVNWDTLDDPIAEMERRFAPPRTAPPR